MVGPKGITLIQITLDLIFFLLVIFSYFNMIFQYMDYFSIGTLKLTYRFKDKSINLDAYVEGLYEQIDHYFCDKDPNIVQELDEICDKLDHFKGAGITYVTLSCIANIVLILGMIHLFSRLFKSTNSFLMFPFYHLIYPCFYTIALACFFGISEIFTLTPPSGFGGSCDVKAEIGLVAVLAAEVFAIASMIFYFCTRKKMREYKSESEIKAEENQEHLKE